MLLLEKAIYVLSKTKESFLQSSQPRLANLT